MDRPDGIVDFTPDPTLYPFESRWFESKVGPVHYIDEGEGPTVLLMHGNPDWSFLYRNIVIGLRDEFRCVAPDYPGFGLSAHPLGYGFTPAEHAVVIGELVDHLDLSDMIVMGQDWGGPISLDVASRRADRVRGLVMGNTWFWPENSRMMRMFSKTMSSRPIQRLIMAGKECLHAVQQNEEEHDAAQPRHTGQGADDRKHHGDDPAHDAQTGTPPNLRPRQQHPCRHDYALCAKARPGPDHWPTPSWPVPDIVT